MRHHAKHKKTVSLKKVVLTGGPGVGKTSIIKHLRELKYEVRDEVFTQLFAQAQKENRFDEHFLHSRELIHDLVSFQRELESQPSQSDLLFLDRSLIDIWGFAKGMGITPFEEDQIELENSHYDLIFVIDPLPEKYYDQNLIRRQNYPESLEHHLAGVQRYVQYLEFKGRDPKTCLIRVPFRELDLKASVMERSQFILSKIVKQG